MFERFTGPARQAVVRAQTEARILSHGHIGTGHLLLGLLGRDKDISTRALNNLGINLENARAEVARLWGTGIQTPGEHIPFTPRGKKLLELALREALQLGHNYIGTEHLLLGLVREGTGTGTETVVALGVDLPRLRMEIIRVLQADSGVETGAKAVPRSREGIEKEIEHHEAAIMSLKAELDSLEVG